MSESTYNLRKPFRNISDFAKWAKRNCGSRIHQLDGQSYGCEMLRELDGAVTSDWLIKRSTANRIGLPNDSQPHCEEPELCLVRISKRAKAKPAEEKAP